MGRQIMWFDNRADYERYVRQDLNQRRMRELEISKLEVYNLLGIPYTFEYPE